MQYMPGSELIRKNVTINASSEFVSDAYRISVVFNNLVSNAIKYADNHKENPFLNISVHIDQGKAVFIIEDNGIGIGKEYLSKVFDMFFRATMAKDGAGLGLYIVKETVEKLYGKISIESEPRVGTSFKIELPNFLTFTPEE
jgi:signal transduction histidine kinase